MILTCPNCNTQHHRYLSEIHHKACSAACGQRLRFLNICDKLGKSNFKKLYEVEKKSFREIERITGRPVKTLRKVAVHFGIEVRQGSEAVSNQWAGNPTRRKEQSARARTLMTSHGNTKEYHKLMNKGGHHIWRAAVKKRDGNACTKCGETKRLHAHHIISVLDNPALRLDVSNGITLCPKCHSKEHCRP